MFKFEQYFPDEIIEQMKRQQVILCGVNDFAMAVERWLQNKGITVSEIQKPDLKEKRYKEPFFVIADFKEQSAEKWQKKCESYYPGASVIKIVNPVEIRIEISGNCNLRCRSCQTGNHNPEVFSHKGRGFMTPDRYRKILDKIEIEYPDAVSVFFFICGEPFLNPHLKEILKITKEKGYQTVLSSNLSLKISWDKELLSLIDILKISVSGFYQEVYETTHNGGNIELVKKNMLRISELKEEHHLSIRVLIGYHLYVNNQGKDLTDMEKLCQKLGFIFAPVKALYFNLFYLSGAEPFPESAKKFIESCYPEPEKLLTPVPAEPELLRKTCRNRRYTLFIDWDGKVMLCEILHKNAVFEDYLTTDKKEIEEWRKNHAICQLCRQYGLDYK